MTTPPGTLVNSAAARMVGRTPLVELAAIGAGLPHRILAKCEFLNPAGSVKDRIGHHIIRRAEEEHLLLPGKSTLVEATAGNTGVALACAAAGRYRVIVTMSSKMGPDKEAMMRAWGAEVVRCPYDVPPESAESFINTARRIAEETPHSYYVDQFANPWNREAHELTTGPEILEQTGGEVAAFVAGAGTGGTITGVARALTAAGSPARVVLADPAGSILADRLRGGHEPGHGYAIEGIGGDFVPDLLDLGLVDDACEVSDAESVAMCLRLQTEEGLWVGGSSGTAVAAALRLAVTLPGPRSNIVVMLPDGGSRYSSTLFNPSWRTQRGFVSEDPAR
ncbi:cysteine synthase family protein [Streptomyces sp. NBC_00536]|uniref:PLP-dependent cysteine synthase family protein n=1 Tax=Streptomyces sp. NBC_00536 TaxID=2975769 RepID=UPI002E81426B|nr:cysteine synthase family protein [Streptomyces sp. NBC_00536]WUC83284.1 cysteine synthase family protein [Streptomyces sp. NBC_00536]